MGLPLCRVQAQIGAETAFPKRNGEHSCCIDKPTCLCFLALHVLRCSINCVGNVIATLLLGEKTSSDCFRLLYQVSELDVTTLLLAAEISEQLCISFLMRL